MENKRDMMALHLQRRAWQSASPWPIEEGERTRPKRGENGTGCSTDGGSRLMSIRGLELEKAI
jgi:hypothetical protein